MENGCRKTSYGTFIREGAAGSGVSSRGIILASVFAVIRLSSLNCSSASYIICRGQAHYIQIKELSSPFRFAKNIERMLIYCMDRQRRKEEIRERFLSAPLQVPLLVENFFVLLLP